MNIQSVDSAPKYITDFISNNHDNLIQIFENELTSNLFCNCSEKQNKMDIHSINEDQLKEIINIEIWESFKQTLNEHNRIIIVKDLDIDKYFLFNI